MADTVMSCQGSHAVQYCSISIAQSPPAAVGDVVDVVLSHLKFKV